MYDGMANDFFFANHLMETLTTTPRRSPYMHNVTMSPRTTEFQPWAVVCVLGLPHRNTSLILASDDTAAE